MKRAELSFLSQMKVWSSMVRRKMVVLVIPFPTYIGGFLLSQLKFLLGVFKSLGVLVQLILGSFQLLLQSHQVVLKLMVSSLCVCVCFQCRTVSEVIGGEMELAWVRKGAQSAQRDSKGQDRTGTGRKEKEVREAHHALQVQVPWWRSLRHPTVFPQQFGTPQKLYLSRLPLRAISFPTLLFRPLTTQSCKDTFQS